MRRALGASRGRIVRRLLTESLILSLSGAIVGFFIAWAIVHDLAHQDSIALPLLATIHLDAAALAWTFIIAIAIGILFGLAPALRISGGNLQEVIKDNAARTGRGPQSPGASCSVLVISELALASFQLLLVGAGLLLRSFLAVLLDVDLGFNPSACRGDADRSAASHEQGSAREARQFSQVRNRWRRSASRCPIRRHRRHAAARPQPRMGRSLSVGQGITPKMRIRARSSISSPPDICKRWACAFLEGCDFLRERHARQPEPVISSSTWRRAPRRRRAADMLWANSAAGSRPERLLAIIGAIAWMFMKALLEGETPALRSTFPWRRTPDVEGATSIVLLRHGSQRSCLNEKRTGNSSQPQSITTGDRVSSPAVARGSLGLASPLAARCS